MQGEKKNIYIYIHRMYFESINRKVKSLAFKGPDPMRSKIVIKNLIFRQVNHFMFRKYGLTQMNFTLIINCTIL